MNLFELFVKINIDDKASSGIKSVSGNSETLNNKMKVMADRFESAQKKVEALEKEFNESAKKTGTASKETQELADKLNKAEKEASEVKKELNKYNGELGDIPKKSSGAKDAIGSLSSWTVAKGQLMADAIKSVGKGIINIGKYAFEAGSGFEEAMSQVEAISGATADDMVLLGDKAKEMGQKTKYSAEDSAVALKYMAQAGWDTEAMLNGLPGVMNLAAASGEDLARTSDIVTDALTAFGLSADQSTHFADVLTKAANDTNTSVDLLGYTFKYAAPLAGALGYSIEDVAVATGLMANAGIKGEQAGTSLRSVLTNMAKPTEDAAAVMDELNLSLTNQDGTAKDLNEVLEALREGFEGLSEAEKTSNAAALAGKYGMSGLLAVVNASDEDFQKLTESMNNASGAAEQTAKIMQDNLKGRLEELSSSAETFGIALYENMQAPLSEAVVWATDSMNSITAAFEEDGVDGAVKAAGDVISSLVTGLIGGLPSLVETAVSVIQSFVTGLSDNADIIVSGAVSTVVTLTNGILSMLPQIVKLGLDLIVSLALGIANSLPTLIPTIIDTILLIVDTLTNPDMLSKILDAALVLIVELAYGLMEAIPELVDAVLDIIDNLVVFLLDPNNIAKILNAALHIVIALGTGLIDAVPRLLGANATLTKKLVDNFKETDWGEVGRNIVDNLLGGLKKAWTSLKEWFTDAWDGLVGGVKDFLGIHSPSRVFSGIGENMALGVGEGWDDKFNGIKKNIDKSLDFNDATIEINSYAKKPNNSFGGVASKFGTVSVVQNIYSQKQTAADLMEEAVYKQNKAVFMGSNVLMA